MKKAAVAAALVVLVGGAYLGATAYTSHRIAAAYDARVAKLEQQLPFLRVVDRQTDKGLFSSTYSGNVRIGCIPDAAGGKADKPLLIGFRDHVRNGPLPGFAGFGAAVIDSEIVLPAEAPEGLRKYLAGMKPQDIRTTVGYGGGYQTALRLPAGDYTLPEGQLSWPEMRAIGAGRLDGSSASFDGSLSEFAFRGTDKGDGKGASFKLVNLRWQGANRGEGSIWLRPGTSRIEIERVELLAEAGGKPFSAQVGKISYATELSAEQDLLQGKATITANATLQIGPDAKPIQLDQIELQESFKRLHAPTLQKVLETSMADLSACGAEGAPAVDAAARGQEMLRMLAQLLPYAPELSVDKLAVGYEGQRGELSYAVSAPGLTAQDIETPGALQGKLQQNLVLRANARLPAAWIEQLGAQQQVAQADTMLDLAVGKGFVVRDGDHVTSSVVVERGAILVNGKPFGAH
ncbi:YdgA family protein [Variovorax sp. RT4R15]|uniref:YdgA family protein n=1 Tax=Variovorax sp. RT4R15 TaxID=3443737 RepID=UPI003F4661B4